MNISARRYPLLRFSAFCACVLLALAGCSSTDSEPAADADIEQSTSALFVVNINSGTFADTDGELTLTVEPRGRAVMFTDHPDRSASQVSVGSLVSLWSALGFEEDPPNAVLAIDPTSSAESSADIPIEISGAAMDDDGRLTLSYVLLDEAGSDALAAVVNQPLAGAVPESFGPASLFIDNATLPSASGGGGYSFFLSVTPFQADGYACYLDSGLVNLLNDPDSNAQNDFDTNWTSDKQIASQPWPSLTYNYVSLSSVVNCDLSVSGQNVKYTATWYAEGQLPAPTSSGITIQFDMGATTKQAYDAWDPLQKPGTYCGDVGDDGYGQICGEWSVKND